MAGSIYTYQGANKVSIMKDELEVIARDKELSKTELRVLFMLFTELNGFDALNSSAKDPLNFNKVSINRISDSLGLSEKDVKKTLKRLRQAGYIEKGSSSSVENGWRFRF